MRHFALIAVLALTGCQSIAPAAVPADTRFYVRSQPATLRQALAIAGRHLPAGDWHLVAFAGRRLDAGGRTIPAAGSAWTVTFSRYAAPAPATDLQTAVVDVPGDGWTSLRLADLASAPALSPVEAADGLLAADGPDGAALFAPLGGSVGGDLVLASSVVTATANGRSVTYTPGTKQFGEVR